MFKEIKPKTEEEWLKIRTTVITATEMAVLLGLNKWKSVSELVEGKKRFEPFENSYTWMGQQLEPIVVTATNRVLKRNFKLFENGSRSFFLDSDLGLGATPDAGDETTLLECKTTKPHNWLKWHSWPPNYYLAQLYTQMICVGRDEGYLAILSTDLTQKSDILDLPLHIHRLVRDEELDKIFLFEVKRFWEAQAAGKQYRVNRKQVLNIEMALRMSSKRIYG